MKGGGCEAGWERRRVGGRVREEEGVRQGGRGGGCEARWERRRV